MGTTLRNFIQILKQNLLQIQGVFALSMTKYLLHGRVCDMQNCCTRMD